MRSRFILPFCLFTIAFSTLTWTAPPAVAAAAGETNPSKRPAPSFNLPIHNGGSVSLDSLRGKVVFVDFWASWCGPCKMSFPWLRTLHERYASKGFEIVAINLDKTREAADEFLERLPAPFVVAFDPSGKTAEAFKVSAMPSSFLIGPTGEIIYAHAGFDPKKTDMIEGLIREAIAR